MLGIRTAAFVRPESQRTYLAKSARLRGPECDDAGCFRRDRAAMFQGDNVIKETLLSYVRLNVIVVEGDV
eukprot:6720121-Pyramimonas_sp.AAC.2